MYIGFDDKEIIALVESRAYNTIANAAAQWNVEDAEKEGEYNLGYVDGVTDLCEELKAKVREHIEEKEEQKRKAAEIEFIDDTNVKQEDASASKYDN